MIGTATAIAYGILASIVLFKVVDAITGLRVSETEELSGLDLAEHGMMAYPELFAGSETGAGMFINDTLAEEKAAELRSKVLPVVWGEGGAA